MKRLTCEMCGGIDLIKDGGVFICQNCGCKYTTEEAKRMMIQGTVNVHGTVKVDNSAFVEKFRTNARRAKQKEDWEEVEKYYNLVEQNEPTDIEAIFYSAYGKARLSMIESNFYKRKQVCEVFCNSISVIDDNYNVKNSIKNQFIIAQMHADLLSMYRTSFVYNQYRNAGRIVYNNSEKTYSLFSDMAMAFIESLENIIKIDDQIVYWKIIYHQRKYLAINRRLPISTRNENRALAIKVGNKIHAMDPTFEIEMIPEAKFFGGCYIATAVYGSYDCPQVWTLRRYRDSILAVTWLGRTFIHLYYATSPIIVKWFGYNKWFIKMWRVVLDRTISRLKSIGVDDTPYVDIE